MTGSTVPQPALLHQVRAQHAELFRCRNG
jgi:hypothetical protein